MEITRKCCRGLVRILNILSWRRRIDIWGFQGVEIVRKLCSLDTTSNGRVVHLLQLLFVNYLGSKSLINFLSFHYLSSEIFQEEGFSFVNVRFSLHYLRLLWLLSRPSTCRFNMTRRRWSNCLIFDSRIENTDIFINDGMILTQRLIYFCSWLIPGITRAYTEATSISLYPNLTATMKIFLWDFSLPSFGINLFLMLMHWRLWLLLLIARYRRRIRWLLLNELAWPLETFFVLNCTFLIVIFFAHVRVFFPIINPRFLFRARDYLRRYTPSLCRRWLVSASCRGLSISLTGLHGRREVNAVNLIDDAHWIYLVFLWGRLLRVFLSALAPWVWGRGAAVLHRCVIMGRTFSLTITFQDAAIIFENELRWWILTSWEIWPCILELTVQVVQLKHQEVILLIIKILSWLEIDGHIILDSHVKDIVKIMHDLLSVLRVLKDHSKIWKIFFAASISVSGCIKVQNASQIDSSFKILVYFLRSVTNGFSSWEIWETLVYPFYYFGK